MNMDVGGSSNLDKWWRMGIYTHLPKTSSWPVVRPPPDSPVAQHPSPAPHLITSKYYGPFGLRDFSPNPAFFL